MPIYADTVMSWNCAARFEVLNLFAEAWLAATSWKRIALFEFGVYRLGLRCGNLGPFIALPTRPPILVERVEPDMLSDVLSQHRPYFAKKRLRPPAPYRSAWRSSQQRGACRR